MKQKIIVGVLGLAVDKQGKFLLTKRHQPQTPAVHNKWNIPGGGLEFGETPEETLKREFWEELRVIPTIIYPQPIPITTVWYAQTTQSNTDVQVLLLCYLVDIQAQTIDLSHDPEEETSAYQWFDLNKIEPTQCLPKTLDTLQQASIIIKQRDILKQLC